MRGSLKNALDWLVSSGELYGKPVAWCYRPPSPCSRSCLPWKRCIARTSG
ncbi:MAG: hypothetical protein JO020_07170 [Chloroflexi bacterium]|nr:hypothetical protein [Chloroflexota bacterium]